MKSYEFEGKLMGSAFAVEIVGMDEAEAKSAFGAARRAGDALEAMCSRFLADSELSRLNEAGEAKVSPEFFALAALAQTLSEETGDAFNPLVQIARFGYDEDLSAVAGRERKARTGGYSASWDDVAFDPEIPAIALGPGQALDFGGFLKGHAAEILARGIVTLGASGALVNIGGDIYGAGCDADGEPFSVAIFDPIAGDDRFVMRAADGAVATSGTYRRKWRVDGATRSHILDGEGREAADGGLASASVAHESGARAEALATAAMVLGPEDAPPLLAHAGATEWILIGEDGSITRNRRAE